MASSFALPALCLIRLPGEFGPILRCYGELSAATAERLQQELSLLEPLDHDALIVNLSGCQFLDAHGVLPLLQSFRRRRKQKRWLVVVATRGRVGKQLQGMKFERAVPVFPTEEEAAAELRCSGAWDRLSLPAPPTWGAALLETQLHWRLIQEALEQAEPEEGLRLLTSMTALCERSEELFRAGTMLAHSRCEFCPLFYEWGGQPEDVGCGSMVNPIMSAVRAGDERSARTQVAAVLRTLEEMYLMEEGRPPLPRPISA